MSLSSTVDCLDEMVISGFSGDLKTYNVAKSKLDAYIIEEVVKEFGLEEAISEKVLTQEEADEYRRTH